MLARLVLPKKSGGAVLVGDLDFAEAKQHLDDVAGFNVGGAAARAEEGALGS